MLTNASKSYLDFYRRNHSEMSGKKVTSIYQYTHHHIQQTSSTCWPLRGASGRMCPLSSSRSLACKTVVAGEIASRCMMWGYSKSCSLSQIWSSPLSLSTIINCNKKHDVFKHEVMEAAGGEPDSWLKYGRVKALGTCRKCRSKIK